MEEGAVLVAVSMLASFWENLLNSALFEGLQKEAVSMTAAVTP